MLIIFYEHERKGMTGILKNRLKTGIIWALSLALMVIASEGCKAPEKIFTIGIISSTSTGDIAYEGFREGMADAGFIEGKDVRYILKIINEADDADIDSAISGLLTQDVDILLAFGRRGSIRAGGILKGTDMPVLFCGNAWPVDDGLVESINRPGGNITGVSPANSIAKALEWLTMIVPGVKKVWVPYNPDDDMSMAEMPELHKAASLLGLELILHEVHSLEEAVSALEALSGDIKAVFRIPSSTLDKSRGELSRAAVNRGLPMGSSIQLNEDVLITLTNDFFDAGKKTARLAQQIHQGIKPADIPVETSEVLLTVNLKIAERLGIDIPDDMLARAKTIIR